MAHTAQPQRSRTNIIPRIISIALLMAATLATAFLGTTRVQGQTYKALHYFNRYDGEVPDAVTGDSNGHLYGTTVFGGQFRPDRDSLTMGYTGSPLSSLTLVLPHP